ncbi:hypothetical protein GC209_00670 [bacterium]|nr:hypothetical protein [bacterium]
MSHLEKLERLRQISSLLLDSKLVAVERAARARQHSLDLLAELDLPAAPIDLPPILAGEVTMRYELWADQRRSELNLVLARQSAEWAEARQEAALAFGRNQVVAKLGSQRK